MGNGQSSVDNSRPVELQFATHAQQIKLWILGASAINGANLAHRTDRPSRNLMHWSVELSTVAFWFPNGQWMDKRDCPSDPQTNQTLSKKPWLSLQPFGMFVDPGPITNSAAMPGGHGFLTQSSWGITARWRNRYPHR